MEEQHIIVRKAEKNDITAVIALVKELAIYEKSAHKMTAGQSIYESAFDAQQFEAFIAEIDEDIIGVAIYYTRFSTWKGPILYLEDFIVREEHRRMGIGKLLFERYIAEARDRAYAMCMWQVLDWNIPAMSFYNKYDVHYEDCWVDVKMHFAD